MCFGTDVSTFLVVDPFKKIWSLYVLVAIGIVLDQRVGVLIPDGAMGSGVIVLHYGLVQQVVGEVLVALGLAIPARNFDAWRCRAVVRWRERRQPEALAGSRWIWWILSICA